MRRFSWRRSAGALSAALLGLGSPGAALAQWVRADSPNFQVLAKAPQSLVTREVKNLERLRHAMLLSFGIDPRTAPQRPAVTIVLSTDESLTRRVSPHAGEAAGMFVRGIDGAIGFSEVQRNTRRTDPTAQVLFHEYAHRVMAQFARQSYPAWYVEGFAEYFGVTQIDHESLAIGARHPSVLLLDNGRWLSAERLLQPSFVSSGDKGANSDGSLHQFYVQAWLLTHYMLSDSERTRRFNDYFRRVAVGEDAIAAFEPATGIAVGKLNATLEAYRDKMFQSRLPLADLPDVSVTLTPVPTDEAEAELDALIAVSTHPREPHGTSVLERLRERVRAAGGDKAPEAMRWSLAHAELRHGDPVQALEILSPWAQRDDAPFIPSRLLGLAWLAHADRESGTEAANAADQARAFLMQAYKQRRNDPSTLYHLARALRARGPSASLSNAAENAAQLEPTITAYVGQAAAVHLQSGDRSKAASNLRLLAANAHGGPLAERARGALRSLDAGQPLTEVLARLNDAPRQEPAASRP